ncbi:protein LURP-one-related 10-like [Macadamia integrifolia]|uniref:protein LURP-one-related 10-like n=1 Tax=Macadamia integrifolia TaxID=60698 RepID=UPI001C4F658A|nr:protein LURP-one-related 10-like [Macadamia integrifolia]
MAMAELSNNPPLTNPVIVVGPQFCAPNPVYLTIVSKVLSLGVGNFNVAVDGNNVFEVKSILLSFHGRRVLLDANGNPILSMRKKILSAHWRWEVFRGESWDSKDLLFSTKKSSLFQLKTELDVFLAANTKEEVCDFKVKGSWLKRSCNIYVGEDSSNIIIAQMHKKQSVQSVLFGKDNFAVTAYPNVDYAFIVALIVILDAINEDRKGRTHNAAGAGVTVTGAIG